MAAITEIKIFPRIGIARVGNSSYLTEDKGWFYGPEVPGRYDTPKTLKDDKGAIKRQAARFRVYGYDSYKKVVKELNEDAGYILEWTVQVANQKAAWYNFQGREEPEPFEEGNRKLRNPKVQRDVDPHKRNKLIVNSSQTISGVSQSALPLDGDFFGSQAKSTNVHLGDVLTDEQGRLVFLAGLGDSRSVAEKDKPYPLLMNDFDSADWIDDTCDGIVSVTVTKKGNTRKTYTPKYKARVIGTTPKFAPGVYAPTSLYDVIEDVYEETKRKKDDYKGCGKVRWYEHIWPLLQKPALLAWVNTTANRGHGPGGAGNFWEEGWQKVLSDPSEENRTFRQNVLGRMRLPKAEKYKKARAGQGFGYFMPELSGDNGRLTQGDLSTFSSITELQFDRLTKWANGEFELEKKPAGPFASINEILLQDRPAALSKAALENTIGAPLYPGIEMSWNAELSDTYQLDELFTINDSQQPGDLTKYLSLPWQSDFYMCRSYWWPSVRPDEIVRHDEWLRIAKTEPDFIKVNQKVERVPWERGLRLNYTDEFEDQPYFANTDMVQNWDKLGFIVPYDRGEPQFMPILVETERTEPSDTKQKSFQRSNVLLGNSEIPAGDKLGAIHKNLRHRSRITPIILPFPKPLRAKKPNGDENPPIQTLDSLKKHLEAAMAVELSTIPLYLFAMYSVKIPAKFAGDSKYRDPVISAIQGVVGEEMLHLSLAGNILVSIGGSPKLYDPAVVPTYPAPMRGRKDELKLELRQLTKPNLDTFIAVEQPQEAGAKAESEKYETLGQFYEAIKSGLDYLSKNGRNATSIFDASKKSLQFEPGVGYQPRIRDAGGSVVVVDLASAKKAIQIIVDQGEGNPSGGKTDDDDELEKDHWQIFTELKTEYTDWEVYPVRSNPITTDYWKDDPKISLVSLAFDAAYCYLLITIEKLWTVDKKDTRKELVLGNMFAIMFGVLGPLARFLVQQPIGKDGEVAAPCFGYYTFEKGSKLSQLQAEIQTAIDSYLNETEETSTMRAVHNYGPQLEMLLPVQAAINSLLDIDTV